MLPHVLDELRLAGVPDESVYIVIALGTHRPMTDAEMDLKIGRELAARFNIVNIPAHNDEHMLYMGESQGGHSHLGEQKPWPVPICASAWA